MTTATDIIRRLNTAQLRIFEALLIARKDNDTGKIVEIVTGTTPEDCAAISEVLKDLEELDLTVAAV